MSPRLDRRTTENRDPHTVYLTVETWDALEHAYLQQRMADASRASKIEFIEDLIRRGLPGQGRARALASPSPAANTEPAPPPAAASSSVASSTRRLRAAWLRASAVATGSAPADGDLIGEIETGFHFTGKHPLPDCRA